MYSFNLKKMQQLPRGEDGRVAAGSKRNRISQANFEDEFVPGYIGSLHATKGWRQRNLEWIRRHGEFIRNLDERIQANKRAAG